MRLIIHASFLSHDDPARALVFYRDLLGFEVRGDVGYDGKRWITVGPVDQPDTSIVLEPAAAAPGLTEEERETIAAMMAKGTYGGLLLASADLDATFERLKQAGVEIAQEPTDQPYGLRDCAVRDPAGNMIRIQELR
ncbi:catechol 2,3-dioxygenase-like lactoylglutathione lyase family enzyme [Agromyces sp. 3263]|uniref:VOC family protein n=1 Tax=Agromyces sp. 3263 TaxID=2817750 RepID=UPI0028595232|nr:VOC family protein [Agromyces sp. 3263]MDR6907238.1 catechol 2,3-dioxygenase-like lactoylglutathione lyase family enzyme [Agromyces sp. 3263]